MSLPVPDITKIVSETASKLSELFETMDSDRGVFNSVFCGKLDDLILSHMRDELLVQATEDNRKKLLNAFKSSDSYSFVAYATLGYDASHNMVKVHTLFDLIDIADKVNRVFLYDHEKNEMKVFNADKLSVEAVSARHLLYRLEECSQNSEERNFMYVTKLTNMIIELKEVVD